ncbi:hypothetical protein KSS87_023304 [Heliosperma pusillum]|nr:hypothetical protein KSS87_023304 [Heliosperma pusillum]
MTRLTLSLSPTPTSSLPLFPPKPPLSAAVTPPSPTEKSPAISRRIAALIPLISTAASPAFAFDFDFRISGPKDWLKEQKKKSVKYLLAPIIASREILSYAQQLLCM